MSVIINPASSGGGGPFQPLDADLTAIAALTGTGIACRIAGNTWALRNLVDAGSGRVLVTNPGGVAGNITVDVDEAALDLAALGGLLGWAQIDFTGSDLADLATRDHDDLQNVTANQHHNQVHVLATGLGLGPDHTVSGLVTGRVLQATSATTAAFETLSVSDVGNGQPLTATPDTNVVLTVVSGGSAQLLQSADLVVSWAGQLPITRGGTGQATALAAFNALSPLTTRGDLLTRDATNNVRLAVGTAARYLRSDGTDPSWQQIAYADISGTPATVSIAGGVGITNTPEPIVGAGTVDLDINSLTSETTFATGDLLAFVDVSVGTTPASQRKVTGGNLAAGINALLVHNTLSGLTTGDPHTQYVAIAGRAGTANDFIVSTDGNGSITGSDATSGQLILNGGPHGATLTPRVVVTPALGNIGNATAQVMEIAKTLTFNNAGSILNCFTMSEHGVWTITANLLGIGTIGSRGFVFAPTLTIPSTLTDFGFHTQGFYAPQIEVASGQTASGGVMVAYTDIGTAGSTANAGTLTVLEWTSLDSRVAISGGTGTATITTRRGLRYRNRATAGTTTMTNSVAVDVEDQTIATLAAAVRSAIASGTGKWAILSTGTADSSFAGRMFIGGAASTVPVCDLDVDGDLDIRSADITLANGANSNIAIGARSYVHIIGPTGAFSTTGFAGGVDGKILVVKSTVNQTWTITNNATSTAANQILTVDGANVVLAAGAAGEQAVAVFIYSATAQRWILLSARDTAGPR